MQPSLGNAFAKKNTFPRKRFEYNDRCFLRAPCQDVITETVQLSVVSRKGACEEKTWSVQLKNLHC
jgi:hypothetical protein